MTRAVPYSKSDERFYTRLAEGSGWSGRNLWRLHHAHFEHRTGRARDVLDRVWRIPSTRTPSRTYRIDLKAKKCDCGGFVVGNCPHVRIAEAAERLFLAENAYNALIFPDRRIVFSPDGQVTTVKHA